MTGYPKHATDKNWAIRLGGRVSAVASDLFAHPYMQIGVILFCVAWFALLLPTDLLTAALSILAITLTQMVLNRQNEREHDAHRRDVAMHAKLDELVIASRSARNEMAGIEELEEDEITELKDRAAKAIEDVSDEPDEEHRRMPKERRTNKGRRAL